MRTIRNLTFVLFCVVLASTGTLDGSQAVNGFVQAYDCDSPTYWTNGQCYEWGVTLYCNPGMYYGFFCEDAEYMCDAHCASMYSAEGNLEGCFATDLEGGATCECMGYCTR